MCYLEEAIVVTDLLAFVKAIDETVWSIIKKTPTYTIQFYTNPNFLAFELFKTENRNCSFCNNIDEARKWNSDYATDLADCGMYNTPSNVQFADPIHKPEEYGGKEKNNENHNQKTIHPL